MCGHSAFVGQPIGSGRSERFELGGGQFFHDCGVHAIDDLIALAYDLAWFWKIDPEQMMARPLDLILESLSHAQRINQSQQVQ
ncbi:hypothetical protein PproGo58_33590 [Pseudomonas protegens]|nr:hypothetical protein PproGo58_33590 [Pseudomonas protegens]